MQIGYIKAKAYTSEAQIPIENAVLSVYNVQNDNEILLGIRLTNSEGQTEVIQVEAPDSFLSQNQGNFKPFAVVNARVDHPEYKTVYINGAQVFAGQISIVEAAMLPIGRNVATDSRAERFDVPEQNL